jgi:hypothetical protein
MSAAPQQDFFVPGDIVLVHGQGKHALAVVKAVRVERVLIQIGNGNLDWVDCFKLEHVGG